jgi:hypothetical protein
VRARVQSQEKRPGAFNPFGRFRVVPSRQGIRIKLRGVFSLEPVAAVQKPSGFAGDDAEETSGFAGGDGAISGDARLFADPARGSALLARSFAETANDAALLAGRFADSANDAALLAGRFADSANDAASLARRFADSANDAALLARRFANSANDAALLAQGFAGSENRRGFRDNILGQSPFLRNFA